LDNTNKTSVAPFPGALDNSDSTELVKSTSVATADQLHARLESEIVPNTRQLHSSGDITRGANPDKDFKEFGTGI